MFLKANMKRMDLNGSGKLKANNKAIGNQLSVSAGGPRSREGGGRQWAWPRAERYTGDVGAGPRVSFGPRGG